MALSIGSFLVREGSSADDNIYSLASGEAYLGLGGSDTVFSKSGFASIYSKGAYWAIPCLISGGGGADQYHVAVGSFAIIADASKSDSDSLRIYDTVSNITEFFSIDNRHVFITTRLGTSVLAADVLNGAGTIESIRFSDISFSGSINSIQAQLNALKTRPNQTLDGMIESGLFNPSVMGLQSSAELNRIINSLYSYNAVNTYATSLITRNLAGPVNYSKNSFDYTFYNLGGSRYGIQEKGSTRIDEITGASSLKFTDQTLTPANDVAATFNQVKGKDDVSGVVFRLYNAAFSRLPDANGLQNWINGNTSGGQTYASSSKEFAASQEFKNRYGTNTTDTQYITTLYNNVLGRAPDAAGLANYQALLAGGKDRGALLLDFSESPENRVLFTQVTGLA